MVDAMKTMKLSLRARRAAAATLSLGLSGLLWTLTPTPAAWAAPPSAATAKVLRATGVVKLVDDGEVVLALTLSAEQVARLSKVPNVEAGLPSTPGRLGLFEGNVYVRYQLAADADLVKRAESLVGQKVRVDLGAERRVVRVERAP